MENTKEEMKNFFTGKNITNFHEKRAIVYLIIIAILLIYFSLYAIHDIVDRGTLKDTKAPTVIDPGNNNNNNNNNNNQNQGTDYNGNTPVVDNSDRFRILEGAKEWSELKELSIFSESYNSHIVDGKIAPGAKGTYNFTVENYGKTTMKYDIDFTEENPYKVNMKYKIKFNGNYVAGDDSTWVDYNQMNQSNRIIKANTKDIYTIEWKWVDAPNDTEVGETDGANYKLHVKAYAEDI